MLIVKGHWSLVTLITVSTFWSKKDRVTSDQVCSKSHTCHTKMVRPLCGRLWPYSCPKHDFWRKSRRKASFLSFVASFLKEVSQKSFVFEFRSFIFEGSLAEKLRFRASKLHFWRKSRRKVWFLSFEASFLKEVSQKSFVLELRSFIFEGSLAEKFGFWVSKLHFWRKSRRKASFKGFEARFLSLEASVLKEVS